MMEGPRLPKPAVFSAVDLSTIYPLWEPFELAQYLHVQRGTNSKINSSRARPGQPSTRS